MIMNNNVLICWMINEQNSYGLLARRLALITGRLLVPSSLTLNGLFSVVETDGAENIFVAGVADGTALN